MPKLKLTPFKKAYGPVTRAEVFIFNWLDIPEPGQKFFADMKIRQGQFHNDTYVEYEPNDEEMDDTTPKEYRLGKTSLDGYITQHLPEKYQRPYSERVGLARVLIRIWW